MLEFKQSRCNFAAELSPVNVPSSLSLWHIPEPKFCVHVKRFIKSYTRPCVRAKASSETPGEHRDAWDLSPCSVLQSGGGSGLWRAPGHGAAPGTARPSRDQPRRLQRDSCFGGLL